MRLRAAHEMYAALMGYFWLPCPLCGQEFGGHEWRDIDGKSSTLTIESHPDGYRYRGEGICPDCTVAGRGDPFWRTEDVRS